MNICTLQDMGHNVIDLLENAGGTDIPIILIHEQDADQGGCAFNKNFKQVPQ